MTHETMTFEDLAPAEVPVKIGEHDYILREASGGTAVAFRNASIEGSAIKDGKMTMGNIAGAEPLLVSRCLFRILVQPDGTRKERPVEEATVRAWPSRILKALFAKVKEISGLEEEDKDLDSLRKERDALNKKIQEAETGEDPTSASPESTTDGFE